MPVNKPHLHEPGIYFITFTNYNWLPLIRQTNAYDAVYKWFDYLKNKGHRITGYVIMPNHIHILVAFTNTQQSINTIVGNGKRFIAYDIVRRLKEMKQFEVLDVLAKAVDAKDKQRGKLHEVFQPSFDIKECNNRSFVNQKLAYIHNNPLSKKWALAQDTISYSHSSARFYETGEQGIYVVTNFMDVLYSY